MIENLEEDISLFRVDGKTFEETLPDIFRIVYFYVRLHYDKWKPLMKANVYSIDDVAQDMFFNLCNKKNGQAYSNIEKKFIQAAKEDLGMKYIRNVIGKAVYLNVTCIARNFNRKPKPISIEDIYTQDSATNSEDHFEFLEDKSQSIEAKASYNLFLESLGNHVYCDYYMEKFGSLKMLDVLDVIDMITDKMTISEMTQVVFTSKKSNITYKRMNEIVKEVRQMARKSYDEGNCLIDIDFKEK